jgi:serine/threonine protein kinase
MYMMTLIQMMRFMQPAVQPEHLHVCVLLLLLQGSLRGALNQQRLIDPSSPYRLPAIHLVLALAHDVACAMLHLHTEQIVHADLKASNVLLTKANTFAPFTVASGDTSSDGDHAQPGSCAALLATAQAVAGGRLVAKVADFGLSLALDPGSTHISHMHAGTLTHMSPEVSNKHLRAWTCFSPPLVMPQQWFACRAVHAFRTGLGQLLTGMQQLSLLSVWVWQFKSFLRTYSCVLAVAAACASKQGV